MPNGSFGPDATCSSLDRTLRQPSFDSRPDLEALIGDAHGMQPANGSTAAQLQDADVPERPQFREFIGEMQHAVDHRVLREEPARALRVGQEQHGAGREIGQRLNLVQELLELAIGR